MYLHTLKQLGNPNPEQPQSLSDKQVAYLVNSPYLLTAPEYLDVLDKLLPRIPADMRAKTLGRALVQATVDGHTQAADKIIAYVESLHDPELTTQVHDYNAAPFYDAVNKAAETGDGEQFVRLLRLWRRFGEEPLDDTSLSVGTMLMAQRGHTQAVVETALALAEILSEAELSLELRSMLSFAVEAGHKDTAHALLEKTSQLPNGASLIRGMVQRDRFARDLWESTTYEDYEHPDKDVFPNDGAVISDNSPVVLSLVEKAKHYVGTDLVREMLTSDELYGVIEKMLLSEKKLFKDTEVVKDILAEARAHGDSKLAYDMLASQGMRNAFVSACKEGCIEAAELVMEEAKAEEQALKLNSSTLSGDLISYDNFAPLRMAEEHGHHELTYALLAVTPEYLRPQALAALPESKRKTLKSYDLPKHEVWQEIGGGKYHWKSVTGKTAPHDSLSEHSPYRFKQPLYDELLPLMQRACDIEGNQGAEENAYKLAVLFPNLEEADRYITNYATKWATEGDTQIVHDACLFTLPKTGVWDVNRWKDFALKYGPAVTRYLEHAPMVDRFLAERNQPFPRTPQQLRSIVEAQISYKRGHERPDLAELAVQYSLTEERFNAALDVLQNKGKTKDNLPHVFIDGADFGYPNYYMSKLEVSDPKGLILGEITNNCQSIGKNGEGPAIHGMTSENGGFYVWKRKTNGRMSEKDPIVAQSWAWLGQDGVLVFDSFERLDSVYNKLAQPFMEQFAHRVITEHPHRYVLADTAGEKKEHIVTTVHLGTGGYTPENIHLPRAEKLAEPLDYKGYRDSEPTPRTPNIGQLIIPPVDHASTPDKALPPPKDDKQVELAARNYIRRTLKKFEERYGIKVRAGIELEFYAVDEDDKPTSKVLDLEKVSGAFRNSPFVERIDHENTTDYKGQYEAIIGVNPPKGKPRMPHHGDPMRAAMGAEAVRKHLVAHAKEHGLERVDFSPLPFEEQEASGAHISISLWDTDGKPLFGFHQGAMTPIMGAALKGMLDIQRPSTLLYAQNDKAYKRYGNTDWSPNIIGVSGTGGSGHSLRIANASDYAHLKPTAPPENVRIENRLASSDANYIIAMAATLAGVDNALEKYVTVAESTATNTDKANEDGTFETKAGNKTLCIKQSDIERFDTYALPMNRFDAADAFKVGLEEYGLSKLLGKEFSTALLQQHHIAEHQLQRA